MPAAPPVGDFRAGDITGCFIIPFFQHLLSMHPDYVMVAQLWPHSPERSDDLFANWPFIGCVRARPIIIQTRGNILGNDQPAGLARVRVEPARHRVARVSTGALFSRESIPAAVGSRVSARAWGIEFACDPHHSGMISHTTPSYRAGHKGLVTAAYLAAPGEKSSCSERRERSADASSPRNSGPALKSPPPATSTTSSGRESSVISTQTPGFVMLPRSPSSFTPLPMARTS